MLFGYFLAKNERILLDVYLASQFSTKSYLKSEIFSLIDSGIVQLLFVYEIVGSCLSVGPSGL